MAHLKNMVLLERVWVSTSQVFHIVYDDIVLALPARHDRETLVLADSLDMSYSTKYSLRFLQQRFMILYEGIRFLHFLCYPVENVILNPCELGFKAC